MGETAKDQPQVRRVGRPRKVKELPTAVEGAVANPYQAPTATEMAEMSAAVPLPDVSRAQDLALRIWEGQSPDLPRYMRVKYVTDGVTAQGMSMDGVTLPPTHDS